MIPARFRPTRPVRAVRGRLQRRMGRGDRGDFSAQYILLTALAISVAVTVGAILTDMLVSGAESLDLGINP